MHDNLVGGDDGNWRCIPAHCLGPTSQRDLQIKKSFFNSCHCNTSNPYTGSDIANARSNTHDEDLKRSVSTSRQHNTAPHTINFHAFLAFIAFIAFGASAAAAFLAPFFAMLLITGELKQWRIQVSSETNFLVLENSNVFNVPAIDEIQPQHNTGTEAFWASRWNLCSSPIGRHEVSLQTRQSYYKILSHFWSRKTVFR
jgi:hypothetical protein